jgi:hypothetical protein
VSGNNYSFDDISIPQPPILVEGQMVDYLTEKIPVFFNSQYLALLDFVSAVQNAFLIDSDQVNSLDADKITNNTQFTQSVFIGSESKIKLDGLNDLITVDDRQGTPVTRVKIGKLGAGTNEYGVQVIDAGGTIRFQSGTSTFLDGGIISADSITATQIAASTITTTELAANTITADDIAAGTITATELAAGAVTAGKINVTELSAIVADLGTVTAGTITGGTVQTAASGARVELASSGLNAYKADGTQTVDINADGTFTFGPSGGDNVSWNNTSLTVSGDIIATGNIQDGAITVPTVTTGTSSDGSNIDLVVSTKGGNVIGTISVVAVVRGFSSVGTGIGNMRVQIDGNTFKNSVGSFATSGGGSVVVGQNTDGQTCTGTFLDGNPAGSISSAANTTYTVAVDITDVITDTNLSLVSYTATLVTLETFK